MMQTMTYDLASLFVFIYILTHFYGLALTLQDRSQEKIANEYIVDKWRLWYRFLDINHKGEISRADVKDEEKTFASLYRLDAKQKNVTQEEEDRQWDKGVFRGRSGAINEDEFVEMNIKLYTADQAKFKDKMENILNEVFTGIIDVNHDGSISEEEYVNALRVYGHRNTTLDRDVFSMYNPVDGNVSVKFLIEVWVQFTSSNDDSKRDIVKEALETGV